MSRFEIAFSGQILPGADPGQVRANLARVFQADDQRIAMLFSGRRMVIKSDLDEVAAENTGPPWSAPVPWLKCSH